MQFITYTAATRLEALAATLVLATLFAPQEATAAVETKPEASPPEAGVLTPGAGYGQPSAQVSSARPEPQGGLRGTDKSGATKPPVQPAASPPVPKAAPAGNLRSGGLGTIAEVALALAASLALVGAVVALRSARQFRRPRTLAPIDQTAFAESTSASRVGERMPATEVHGSQATPVLGYASADAQPGHNGSPDLRAQAEKIAAECESRGLSLMELVREREPQRGAALERPGLGYALQRISAGEAKGLVVAELSRLTHSVPDLGRVLEWFLRSDVRLVAAAERLDTQDDAGRLTVRALIQVSSWERERLIERTRNGMRAARRKGPPGVADYPELSDRIARMRADGMTLQAIADRLNAEGVPTVRGGAKWRPSSVQAAAGYRRPAAGNRLGPARGNQGG